MSAFILSVISNIEVKLLFSFCGCRRSRERKVGYRITRRCTNVGSEELSLIQNLSLGLIIRVIKNTNHLHIMMGLKT